MDAARVAMRRRCEIRRDDGAEPVDWIMNWWWATVLGPVVLAGAIAYALVSQRRLSTREKSLQDQAVNKLYNDPAGRSSPQGEQRQATTASERNAENRGARQ
jgi:hypothetical protein